MIGLRPETPEELGKRLREMSELELRRFGQQARKLSDPKMNFGSTDPYVVQLDEAWKEWRRRHPNPLRVKAPQASEIGLSPEVEL
jgi:hypothetical protein